ncbi:uncharacterized protein LOC132174537 [Corylus avellana]|uniref:uncharacterized protein LOC132174537 n=1 Tax=Corylus avellana TaxID=13451 RepID=UPI00286CDFA7|nr:uncharacterized protein LOC132174537 [Corylus avellana]
MAAHTGVDSGFKFHPNCLKMKLTHLCFADDLLIFSEASVSSVKVIKAALVEFEELSGLKANPSKSSFYCSGISDRVKNKLLTDLQMKEGNLPVRYLGVPLISSRLSSADCGVLLDRITDLIDSWLSRKLSYKFNRFLWNGKDVEAAKAKVAWSEVCFPKKEGGLGLKRLELLNLRDIAKKFLRFEVGNRENIYLWLDLWHPAEILIEKYGYRAVYDAQSREEAKLSSVIHNGSWFWKPARSDDLVDIQASLLEISLWPIDKPIWTASRKGVFVSSDTWEALREKKEQITWWKLVWFPFAIPKHDFILWLAMKGRLVTGDRLLTWGYNGDVNCVFCRNQLESRDHLFFECSFSYRLWKFCMFRCRVDNVPIVWEDILQLGLNDWGCKSLKAMLCRLVLGSVVYNIWCTRNEIKHAGHPKTEEQLLKKILWEIRTRVVGKGRFPKNKENLVFCSLWNLSAEVLC